MVLVSKYVCEKWGGDIAIIIITFLSPKYDGAFLKGRLTELCPG